MTTEVPSGVSPEGSGLFCHCQWMQSIIVPLGVYGHQCRLSILVSIKYTVTLLHIMTLWLRNMRQGFDRQNEVIRPNSSFPLLR